MNDILVTTHGADATGATDSLAAIHAARDAALLANVALVFPSGTYKISGPLELGFSRLHVRGEGRVYIQADFNGGNIVSIDAGASTIVYQGSFTNFIIRGNGSANQTGLYVRNRVHNHIADVRVRNITKYGFHILSDVFSVYDRLVSDHNNEGLAPPSESWPTHDLYLDATVANGATTACTFNNCIFEEGTSYGVYLNDATDCIFNGGGAEGLAGWGVYVSASSFRNQFNEFYCELNAGGDFDIYGDRNVFINCEAYDGNQTTTQFKVRSGAQGNVIEKCGAFSSGGAALTTVVIDSGAIDTVIRDCDLYSLTDGGTRTWLENWSDTVNGVTRGGSKAFQPTFSGSTTAGTFTYYVRTGAATRIGRRVFFEIGLRISGVSSGATDAETWVGDLPWSAAQGAAPVVDDAAMTYPGGATVLGSLISGTKVSLRGNKNSGYVNPATLTAGSFVRITGHYEVA